MTPKGNGRPDEDDFWSALDDRALHPVRVPMLEATRWIGRPLSAIDLVDVFDGHLSMWEAVHHLQFLRELDVVEPISPYLSLEDLERLEVVELISLGKPEATFRVPYRLKTAASDGE